MLVLTGIKKLLHNYYIKMKSQYIRESYLTNIEREITTPQNANVALCILNLRKI